MEFGGWSLRSWAWCRLHGSSWFSSPLRRRGPSPAPFGYSILWTQKWEIRVCVLFFFWLVLLCFHRKKWVGAHRVSVCRLLDVIACNFCGSSGEKSRRWGSGWRWGRAWGWRAPRPGPAIDRSAALAGLPWHYVNSPRAAAPSPCLGARAASLFTCLWCRRKLPCLGSGWANAAAPACPVRAVLAWGRPSERRCPV